MLFELNMFHQYCIIAGLIVVAIACMLWFVVQGGKQTPLTHIDYRNQYRERYRAILKAKANGTYEDTSLINERGFTLIELCAVLLVVSILSAMAVPYLVPPRGKIYQLEAKSLLKTIYTMQIQHYAIVGQYADYIDELPFNEVPNAWYDYKVYKVGADYFTIRAVANLDDDDKEDIWEIDQAGRMACVSNDVIEENG